MGHFIKHTTGSEQRTHRGGGKAAVHALLKASAVGVRLNALTGKEEGHSRRRGRRTRARTARCSGLGRWMAWGSAPMWGGAPAWGGGWRGAVLRRRGGRGWRGVEMNLDNFNPRLFYTSISSLLVVSRNRR